MTETLNGTLEPNEYHPAADSAKEYILRLPASEITIWSEALASNAMSGNRLAEVCSETLNRLLKGQPVSDRYLLGLAWIIRQGDRS